MAISGMWVLVYASTKVQTPEHYLAHNEQLANNVSTTYPACICRCTEAVASTSHLVKVHEIRLRLILCALENTNHELIFGFSHISG
jgi:hypothetical protein